MQGYILRVQKVRDEDLLVFVLTREFFAKCYRFYGARHPIITQGFKIDFELQGGTQFLPHLRGALHLGFAWLFDRRKLAIWQQFMRLLYDHLKDSSELESFYFDLADECALKFAKGNPQRVLIEGYLNLLEFEGRLHKELSCFLCDKKIDTSLSLARGFLPAHEKCCGKFAFSADKIRQMFESKSTLDLDENEVEQLYFTMLEGI